MNHATYAHLLVDLLIEKIYLTYVNKQFDIKMVGEITIVCIRNNNTKCLLFLTLEQNVGDDLLRRHRDYRQ